MNKTKEEEKINILDINQFYQTAENILKDKLCMNYAVIVLDVDNFKMINELYGIVTGDAVLIFISQFIAENIKECDCYGRIHSDQFCILRAYQEEEELVLLISKLTARFYDRQFGFELKPSFGIYRITDRNVPLRVMCDRADMAKKKIKGSLLKFFEYYDDSFLAQMVKENEIELNMEEAMLKKQFVMYLQPKYSIETERPVGAEALVRWFHPEKGMISPVDFIPLFEKNGFVVILDEYIWEEAFKTIHNWLERAYLPLPISVNISRLHFRDRSFVKTLIDLADKYRVPRHLIELEITESAFFGDWDSILKIMKELKDLGFRLDMDDFGAGYSSLNLLKSVPIDVIKLDQVFLNEKNTTKKGKIVIRSMISMAKEMDIRVIAEGVETKKQADFLLDAGCYLAQGYYYSKPLSREEFEQKVFKSSVG